MLPLTSRALELIAWAARAAALHRTMGVGRWQDGPILGPAYQT